VSVGASALDDRPSRSVEQPTTNLSLRRRKSTWRSVTQWRQHTALVERARGHRSRASAVVVTALVSQARWNRSCVRQTSSLRRHAQMRAQCRPQYHTEGLHARGGGLVIVSNRGRGHVDREAGAPCQQRLPYAPCRRS
jgi:hypothetical protein